MSKCTGFLRARENATYIVIQRKNYKRNVGNMTDVSQPVLVEYTFPGLPHGAVRDLPRQVEAAIQSLVTRERLPSDEDVRAIVRGVAEQEGQENAEHRENQSLSVQVMLPHEIAVDLAMYRSFHTTQPQSPKPLTTVELRALIHRSRRARLRVVRRRMAAAGYARHPPATCVVCLSPVRCIANRIVLECEHEFHRNCITGWLDTKRACPTCRFDVNLELRVDELHFMSARRTRFGWETADEDTESELEEDTVVNF